MEAADKQSLKGLEKNLPMVDDWDMVLLLKFYG